MSLTPQDAKGSVILRDPFLLDDVTAAHFLIAALGGAAWRVTIFAGAPIGDTGCTEMVIMDAPDGRNVLALKALFGRFSNVTKIDRLGHAEQQLDLDPRPIQTDLQSL